MATYLFYISSFCIRSDPKSSINETIPLIYTLIPATEKPNAFWLNNSIVYILNIECLNSKEDKINLMTMND